MEPKLFSTNRLWVVFAAAAMASSLVGDAKAVPPGMETFVLHPTQHPYDEAAGGTVKAAPSEPYGGQIYCPVTGNKLGVSQEAVPVQTTIGEEKPSGLGKYFGKKGKPGAVIYACSPEAAEKVRSDPMRYFLEVSIDRGRFHFSYAQAPNQRPPVKPVEQTQAEVKPAQTNDAPAYGSPAAEVPSPLMAGSTPRP